MDLKTHRISIVIPVYSAENYLEKLVSEIVPLTIKNVSDKGNYYQVHEVFLVNDCGFESSASIIRKLESQFDFVKSIWLSNNFGQHAATIAGMSFSSGDWIVTLDEDGEHNPAAIPKFLDVAVTEKYQLVYALPHKSSNHGVIRNCFSRLAKKITILLIGKSEFGNFQSYRFILGSIGRGVAAYSGNGVFLDVALSWFVQKTGTCESEFRVNAERQSSYTFKKLFSHFRSLVLSSGTRLLRIVAFLGFLLSFVGFSAAGFLVYMKLVNGQTPQGWPSIMVSLLLIGGIILFCIGVISEYLGEVVNAAIGKPLYLVVNDPDSGPLGNKFVNNE